MAMWASMLQRTKATSNLTRRSRCLPFRRCFSADPRPPAPPDAALYMWGTNTKGSLPGIDKLVDVPTQVDWRQMVGVADPDVSLKEIVCGPTDTAFVLSDGQCFVCGENKAGQLGLGHKDPVATPTKLETVNGVSSIVLGPNSSALLDTQKELFTFGFGGSTFSGLGQLGHGDGESYLTPKLVESLVEDGCYAKQVHIGDSHMAVLTTEGEVLTAGAGSYGRLGNFDTVDQLYLEPVEMLVMDVDQIAGGKSFTMALTEGVINSWGRNHKGQLGTGLGMAVDMYAMTSHPNEITADELAGRRVTKIAAGASHAAAITDGGELFYWGMSLYFEPVRVTALLHTKIADVFCGKDYTIALDEDGKIYSFGNGKTGVLGQASTKKLNQPELVEALADKRVVSVSAGWSHLACQVVDE